MTAGAPRAGREGDQGDIDGGALRPQLVEIARGTQEGGKPSLLVPAPLGQGNMSSFKTQESSSGEGPSMRWHAGWSPNRRKAKECDLGPHLP